jgi:hypothetical protein
MKRHWQYLKYILRHKWYVFLAACNLGIPLLGILHDWSKFKPAEWLPYARTFYNKDGSKRYEEYPEFTAAWLHHQKRNKHHWQYWMVTWDRGTTECLPMPDKYRKEMLADWIGAGRALGKPSISGWYVANQDRIKLHPETREWIKYELARLVAKRHSRKTVKR